MTLQRGGMIWWYIIYSLHMARDHIVNDSSFSQNVKWELSNGTEYRLLPRKGIHFEFSTDKKVDLCAHTNFLLSVEIHDAEGPESYRSYFSESFPWSVSSNITDEVIQENGAIVDWFVGEDAP